MTTPIPPPRPLDTSTGWTVGCAIIAMVVAAALVLCAIPFILRLGWGLAERILR